MAPKPVDAAVAEIPLRFDSIGMLVPGILGMLPAATWLVTLSVPFSHFNQKALGVLELPLMVVAIAGFFFVTMILPTLSAILVQRARQPRGARVAWTESAVIEWDGEWQRTTIPWDRLDIGWLRWPPEPGRASSHFEAIQLRDRQTQALIHVWETAPPNAPVVRRRVYAKSGDLQRLLAALEMHSLLLARSRAPSTESSKPTWSLGSPNWSLAADRWRPAWAVSIGRLGYPGAVLAPLLVMPAPWLGAVVATLSTACLVIRALPAYRELRALLDARGAASRSTPEAQALAAKIRASKWEVVFRTLFPVLVIASTTIDFVYLAG